MLPEIRPSLSNSAGIGNLLVGTTASANRPPLTLETLGEHMPVNLRQILELLPNPISIPEQIPDIQFIEIDVNVSPLTNEFSLSGKSVEPWALPLGINGVTIDSTQLLFENNVSANGQLVQSGSLEMALNIGTTAFKAVYQLPGDIIFTGHIPSIGLSLFFKSFQEET